MFAPDKSFFVARVDFGSDDHSEVFDSRDAVIEAVASGEYDYSTPFRSCISRVLWVVEFNAVEDRATDITQDIREAVAARVGEDRCDELIAPLTSPVTAWAIRDAARVAS